MTSALSLRERKQLCRASTLVSELRVIDAEIDCSDLQRLLKPIEANFKRCEQMLDLSRELIALKLKIKEEIGMVEQITQETRNTQDPGDIPVLEENLEALLDNADSFASTIERLKEKNKSLGGIEEVYAHLQDKIESYQEALEEAHSRLGG